MQFPTLFEHETLSGAHLMIQGLQMAGPNPINYSTIFGHDSAKQCVWILRATKSGFVTNPQTVCGTDFRELRPATLPQHV